MLTDSRKDFLCDLLSERFCYIGLGFERERERNGNITKTIRWDRIKDYLVQIDDRYLTPEVGSDLFICESDIYELAMLAKSDRYVFQV